MKLTCKMFQLAQKPAIIAYYMLYAFFLIEFQLIVILFKKILKNICIYKIYIVYLQYQI